MEHQAWSQVHCVGRQQTQRTTGLVKLATIDRLIEQTQRIKHSPILSTLGVHRNTGSMDSDVDADYVYDTLIAKISPQVLQSAVIGQLNYLMNIC